MFPPSTTVAVERYGAVPCGAMRCGTVFPSLNTLAVEREGTVRLTGGAVVEAVEHPKLPRLLDIRPIRPLPPVVVDRPPLLRLPQQLARHARRAQHAAHYVRAAVSL